MPHASNLSGPDLGIGISLRDLPEGEPVLGHANGEAIVLVRTGQDVQAVGATCTHYGGPLADGIVAGGTIRCPWHHACFDLRTGFAAGAPALDPVNCYEVHHRGDRVIVGGAKPRAQSLSPPVSPASVVIVGAGAAGAAACERLRQLGYRGAITMIGEEPPVDRPNLSKDYMAGTAPAEWVVLRTPEFYAGIDVELVHGDAVVALHPRHKLVVLGSGRTVPYGALLLATGCEALRPPTAGATLPHVFTLRTLADARGIIAAVATARRAVVVGSSFIGLEVAASLRARGLDVQVVSRDALPLARVMGAPLGRYIRALHEQHGVRFHLSTGVRAIHRDSVELDDGRMLDADLVVLGVGVRPRTSLAENAGLDVADGIVVDSHLRTSAADIWAAGDVARYPEARAGTSVRIEHWVVAERHGQAVARDMLGLGAPFRDVPFFWSAHHGVTLAYVGHASGNDDIAITGDLARHEATVAYRRAGRVAAVVTIGRDRVSLAIEAALEREDDAAVDALLTHETQ